MIEYTVRVDADTTQWYLNDQLHRENGPAREHANGHKVWFINGNFHREDGPAVEYNNGTKFWYINNKLHREDGPAIEYKDGAKAWWLNGVKLSEKEFLAKTQPVKELSVAQLEALLGYKIKVVK